MSWVMEWRWNNISVILSTMMATCEQVWRHAPRRGRVTTLSLLTDKCLDKMDDGHSSTPVDFAPSIECSDHLMQKSLQAKLRYF
ncbi:hypothetical protein PAAG_11243 [Paracoccidioides lutzii Pb01]|uniref:Uncharacterized protein n=1 Tax=Paracoccidioides lutzii (strain ATCC MYA-826 / Pb01) TaxID=502779 RepID=A0A0A2V6U7_PARBA|nr:hypothetical protein PAAG_11243 [Paracoccidioides lutzii Pb01]KGQ02062.1 hypothetical protein PAAG_11243 [Paracoccidioides lutzii Pb01]